MESERLLMQDVNDLPVLQKNMTLILAIIGWRGMTSQTLFDEAIDEFIALYGMPSEVVSGGAIGADTFGEQWARKCNIPITILKPNWRPNGIYDRRAGLNRNTDIINRCTHVLAFPSTKGSGTQDSIRKANECGKNITIKWI